MEITRTITSIFMVPTLNIPKERLHSNGFVNGYSNDSQRDVQYKDSIYILFQPKNLDKFREFLNSEYDRTKSVIDDYDYEDGYVVVVYQLDPLFKSDFELIKHGKYSKTSKNFQELFPKKVTIVNEIGLKSETLSLQYTIFNRSKEMIKYWEDTLGISLSETQELWSKFDDENETLNIDKLKEHVQ